MNWTSYELLMVLWRASWQAATLAVLVYLICRIFQRSIPASAKTLLWLLPVLRLAVLIVPASNFSLFNAMDMLGNRVPAKLQNQTIPSLKPQHQTLPSQNLSSQNLPSETAESAIPQDTTPNHIDERYFTPGSKEDIAIKELAELRQEEVTDSLSMKIAGTTPISESASSTVQLFTTANIVVLVWLVGVSICLIRYLVSQSLLQKVIQSGEAISLASIVSPEVADSLKEKLPRSVRFIAVENQYGPAVTGVLCPVVLLPQRMLAQFSKEELTMVVMHELEHVKRFDTSMLFFAQLATILHWFNPLSYWLRKRLQAQIEIAVDATTVRNLGLDKVKQYAELLFKVSSTNTTPTFLLSMARRSSYFRYRIEQLAETEPRTPLRTLFGALTVIALAMTGLSDLASGEPNSINPNSTGPATVTSGETTANVAEATNAEPKSAVEQQSTVKTTDKPVKSLEKETDPSLLPQPLSVIGKVVDSHGKGVPNAKLLCTPRNKIAPISATTDEAGNFSISFPHDADKFDSFYTWVYAEGFGLRVVAMRRVLKDGESAADVEIPLPPLEQNVTVEVRDPNGNPVPDALVMPVRFELPIGRFYSDEPEGAATPTRNELIESVAARTDQNGIARFNHFPTAMWRGLSCQTTQYGEQRFDFRTNSNQIKISLKPVGSIRGKIASFDPSKFPTLGFEIVTRSIDRKSDLTGVSSGQFNEKGEFQIPVIAAGTISSFRVGTLDASTDNGPELICKDNLQQELKPNSNIEFMLYSPPMVQVSGTVLTSDTRKPVKGVEISVGRKNGPHRRRFTTDENGEFQFGVVPGKVNFQMISRGDANDLTMKYGTAQNFPDLITEDTKLEILLPVNKQVKGRLQDSSGLPLGDCTITRNDAPSGRIGSVATTDANGRFEIYVEKTPLDSNGYWSLVDNADILRRPVTVVNQLSEVDEFYVLEKPREPIAPPRKVVQERPTVRPQSNSDAALPDPTNEEPSSGSGEQESTIKTTDKSDKTDNSARNTAGTSARSDLLSVSGQVVDSQGKGVPKAKLFYIPDYHSNPTQVTTDDGGNFSISYLPREPYEFEPFSTWVWADGFGLRVVAMRRLLHDEKSVKDVKIPLPPLEPNATSVEVRDPKGIPLQDVLVMPDIIELPNGSFMADESEGLGTSIPNQLIELLAVRTDQDGKASLNRFPNALWHGIRCQSDQFGTQSDESARPTRPAKLSLRQVGNIHGKIDSFDPTSFPTLNFLIETKDMAGSNNLKGLGYGKFNEKGEFFIPAIAVGSVDRFLVAKGEICSASEGELICENYRSNKVLPDSTLELELTAPPTARVSGVVLTSDTRVPVPGTKISCYRANSPHHRQFVTNENGEFEIQVVPGKVQFQMINVSTSTEISRKYASAGKQFPDIVTKDTKLEVLLPARKSVKGRLQDVSGKPIANQELWRFGKNRFSINGWCETDAEGNFEMFPFGATIQSEGFWAIVDKSDYRRKGAVKTVVRQISNDGDFYVLEQPSKPIAPPIGK